MFTGLVEDVGKIVDCKTNRDGLRIQIATSLPLNELKLGDSISVNGTCLTVSAFGGKDSLFFDVLPETKKNTCIGQLRNNDYVNLERALRADGRLDGHIVSGHIDGKGKILSLQPRGDSKLMQILIEKNVCEYVFPKASVAINGVSLTVQGLTGLRMDIALVAHTLKHTNLKYLQRGSIVNLETDYLIKTIVHSRREKS